MKLVISKTANIEVEKIRLEIARLEANKARIDLAAKMLEKWL